MNPICPALNERHNTRCALDAGHSDEHEDRHSRLWTTSTDTRTREHLLAENERLSKLEDSLRAHLSRTINRAEKAEKELAEQEADRTPDWQS